MRVYVLWALVAAAVLYARRNPFGPLCLLIILSAFMQRRDFPHELLGITGLNPWNILLVAIILAWVAQWRQTRWRDRIPRRAVAAIVVFVLMIGVAYARAVLDSDNPVANLGYRGGLVSYTATFLVNPLRFLVVAFLVFEMCYTRRRLRIVVMSLCACTMLYSYMVIKAIPLGSLLFSSETAVLMYRHRVDRDVGLMAIDMSMLLGGMTWAMSVFAFFVPLRAWQRTLLILSIGLPATAMALCQSRGSWVGFLGTGVVLGLSRWRLLLWAMPAVALVAAAAMPSMSTRLLTGVGVTGVSGSSENDLHKISAGRWTEIWPAALRQIQKGPVLGFGVDSFDRTGARRELQGTASYTLHPHNAYLRTILDSGFIGLLIVLTVYGGIAFLTFNLFRHSSDPLERAIGGMGLAPVTMLLVCAFGAQSFYPTQSTLLYWCIWALALRAGKPPFVNMRRSGSARACHAEVHNVPEVA